MPGDNPATANVESELRFYAAFGPASASSPSTPPAVRSGKRCSSAASLFSSRFVVLMGLELTLLLFIVWAQTRIAHREDATYRP